MNIREYREQQHKTQTELAKEMGLTRQQYINIEKNPTQTRVETLKKLVKLLQISDEDVLHILKDN